MCEEIAGRELDWTFPTITGRRHRWWISDLEPFKRDYPDWPHLRRAGHPARDPRANAELWVAARMKLSVVIPAHNEVDSIRDTVANGRGGSWRPSSRLRAPGDR